MAAEAKIKITGDSAAALKAFADVEKSAQALQGDLSKIAKVGAVAFAGFAAGIGASVAEAAKFESIEAQFKTLTGSINIAKNVLGELKDFSAKTPFQFEDIANAGKQLIAFGTPVDNVRQRLQQIGDVAAASGAPLKDITLIFGQVAAAGKLTGERLLQLQERAVPIGPALAQTLGIAESKVKQFVSEGKVSVEQFNTAFASLSNAGGFAFGGIEAQGATLNGLISTLKDNFSLLSAGIGQELVPYAKQAVGALTSFLQKIRENEEAVKSIAKFLVAGAGISALVVALATAGIALSKLNVLTFAFRQSVATAFTGALKSVNNFNQGLIVGTTKAVTNFIGGMFQAAAATVKFGLNIKANTTAVLDFAKNATSSAVTAFKNMGTAAVSAAGNVRTFINGIGPNIIAGIKAVPLVMSSIGSSFRKLGASATTASVSAKGFFSSIGPNALSLVKAMPAALSAAGQGFKAMNIGMRIAAIGAKLLTGALTLGLGIILPEIIIFIQDFAKNAIANFNRATTQIITLFKNLGTNLLNIGSKIGEFLKSLFSFDLAQIKAGAQGIKDAVNNTIEQTFSDVQVVKAKIEIEKQKEAKGEGGDGAPDTSAIDAQNAAEEKAAREAMGRKAAIKKEEADMLLAEEKRKADITSAQVGLQNDIIALQTKEGSGELIKIKQEEIDLLKALKDAETEQDQAIAANNLVLFREQAAERQFAAIEAFMLQREAEKQLKDEFALLDEEDRLLLAETNANNLNVEQLQRREALRAYAEGERAQKQTAQKAFLQDQIKYGTAYAKINAAINSDAVKGTSQATGQLTQLQQSRSSTLKGIGKASAIVQIGIETAKSAMSIFAGFSTIPIVGPALGVAGAAAAIAFGAEKANNVRSAQLGGQVPGSGSGDIVPAFLEPGEIVVPRALAPTFEEQFSGLSPDANAPGRKSEIQIGTIIGTEEFVKGSLIPALRDANELDNANIGVS